MAVRVGVVTPAVTLVCDQSRVGLFGRVRRVSARGRARRAGTGRSRRRGTGAAGALPGVSLGTAVVGPALLVGAARAGLALLAGTLIRMALVVRTTLPAAGLVRTTGRWRLPAARILLRVNRAALPFGWPLRLGRALRLGGPLSFGWPLGLPGRPAFG
ncbi:hypothetical protein GCM10009675_09720 [Prauserella alba]|uniref:Uncharacterized protein n=1 Tax=Prauserella alba TaxID=176898 RepID=A0ABN1V646_9PSEU